MNLQPTLSTPPSTINAKKTSSKSKPSKKNPDRPKRRNNYVDCFPSLDEFNDNGAPKTSKKRKATSHSRSDEARPDKTARIYQLEDDLAASRESHEQMRALHDLRMAELHIATDELKDAQRDIEDLRRINDALRDLCDKQYANMDAMTLSQQHMEDTKTALLTAIDEQNAVIAQFQQRCDNGNAEIAELQQHCFGLQQQCTDLQNRLESGPTSDTENSHKCKICWDKPLQIVIIPCYHVAVCEECSSSILLMARPKCPICRGPINDTKNVYL